MPSKYVQRVSQQLQDLRPGQRHRFWFAGGAGPGLLLEPLTRAGAASFTKALDALSAAFPAAITGAVLVDDHGRPIFVAAGADLPWLKGLADWTRANVAEAPPLDLLFGAAAADAPVDALDDHGVSALDPRAVGAARDDLAWQGLLTWSVAQAAAALVNAAPGERFQFWWSNSAEIPLVVQERSVDPQQVRCRAIVERVLGAPWASGWRGGLEVGWDGRLRFEIQGGRPPIWSEAPLDAYRPDLAARRVAEALGGALSTAKLNLLLSNASAIPTLAGSGEIEDPDPGYGLMDATLPTLRGLARPRIELDVQEDLLRFCDGPTTLMELKCNRAELSVLRARLNDLGDPSKPLFDEDTMTRAAALPDPASVDRAVLNPAQNGAALDAMRAIAAEQRQALAAQRAQVEVLRRLGDPADLRVRVFEQQGSLAVGVTRGGDLLWSEDFLTGWRIRLAGSPAARSAGEPEVLAALAAWVRAQVEATPDLARLVNACFVLRGDDDEIKGTVEDPALWEGLAPRPALGTIAGSASALKALRPEQNAWVWLTAKDRLGDPFIALLPSSVASSRAATQERLAALEVRAAAAGQRLLGVLRRVAGGKLIFFTEGDPREAVDAMVAVAARWGVAHPELAELDMVSAARLTDGALTETTVATEGAARTRRLSALATAQGALLAGLSAEARPYFWLSTDADGGAPLLLLDDDSRALTTTLKGLKSVLSAPQAGPTAVQGRARLVPNQPAIFVAREAFPGFDGALGAWIDAHLDEAPGLAGLRGAQLHVRA